MRIAPDSLDSPPAAIAIATGELVYQPAAHAPLLHVIELVGALPSASAVKVPPALERPALFCAVAEPLCVPAVASKLYAPAVCDQPVPRAGYARPERPETLSPDRL